MACSRCVLAEARLAVDEQGVVRLRRRLGDGHRRRVREAVGRADDERVEEVLRVQPRGRLAGTRRRGRLRRQRTGRARRRQVRADRAAAVDVSRAGRRLRQVAAPVVALVVVAAGRLVVGALVVGRAVHRLGTVVLGGRTAVRVRAVRVLRAVRILRAVRVLLRGAVGVLGRRGVRVPVGETEPLLLPAVIVLRGPRPGAGLGALVLRRVGGARRGQLVVRPALLLAAPAVVPAVPLVRLTLLVRLALLPVAVVRALRTLRVDRGQLRLLVARLRTGSGRRRGGRLAGGLVDRDRDTDRAAALTAQALADDRGQTSLEDTLGELVGHGEQRGVGDQGQRLAAPDPVFVLALDTLSTALAEQLLQYAWPHCGKIGRYVSHRARSLTGPPIV
ncbi:hypothetical protein STENM223S_06630 [Streptomyces tendae]